MKTLQTGTLSTRLHRGAVAFLTALVIGNAACERKPPGTSANANPPTNQIADVRARAEQGNATAQTELGRMLLEGNSAKPDYAQAALWLRKAADQGSAEARFYLAGLYEAGRGVERDYSQAVHWNLKAAEAGHGDAQYALALLYATGKGTPKDKPASVKWFRAAANQGLVEAQFNLAQRFQHGQGVETNLIEAYKWFAIAAKNGLRDAVKEGQSIKTELTSAQISEAERAAAAFVPNPKSSGP